MRITNHPILRFTNGEVIYFFYNGIKVKAYTGETIASALQANGITNFGLSSKLKRPRGFFCGIGKCSSCLMNVDRVPNVRTCITEVKEGMIVENNNMMLPNASYQPSAAERHFCDIAVIGGGPAGMSAASEASKYGANVLLIDENTHLGGQLVKQTHKFFGSKQQQAGTRGIDIATELENKVKKNCSILENTSVFGCYNRDGTYLLTAVNNIAQTLYEIEPKKIIFATGAQENMLGFDGNDLPGVFGAGGVQTLMNVYGVKPGNTGIIVGAGNVGLIVAYQLRQAGVKVKCVIEAMPTIGGYFVHAAKIRRIGIPILTRHTIKNAYGGDKVKGATIVRLDDQWRIIEGTDQQISCDFICIAVGLTPAIRLVSQTGAAITFINEAGGWVMLHNEYMQTTTPDIYVAGDLANIEEASTAMMEGRIAGLHAAHSLGKIHLYEPVMQELQNELVIFREGPFGARPFQAKKKIFEGYYEAMGKGRSS